MLASHFVPQLAAALAVGLLIGIERGWKLRDATPGMRVAGIRTFTLLGMTAGLGGIIALLGYPIVSGIVFAVAAALVAIGYSRSVLDTGRPDATSAVAAMVTLGLGFLAGAAVVTLILALRTEAHRWVGALDEADIKAFARYAVIALAVFPFLPEGRYGPYDAWEPRVLWLVVVIVTGFSFVGYVANRMFGARRGTIATAVIGGAYSSTAVTHSFAQRLGSGMGALASAVMYLRVIILVAVLATSLLEPFVVVVAPALIAGFAVSYWLYRRAPSTTGPAPPGNPIAMLPALTFVAFVAVAAVAARWAQGEFGEQGIAILLLLMGSMDVDAAIVTAGGLEPGTISPALAALAIAGTILANMGVKLGVTVAYGRHEARPAAIALAASMVALAASLAFGYARL